MYLSFHNSTSLQVDDILTKVMMRQQHQFLIEKLLFVNQIIQDVGMFNTDIFITSLKLLYLLRYHM